MMGRKLVMWPTTLAIISGLKVANRFLYGSKKGGFTTPIREGGFSGIVGITLVGELRG